MRFSQDFEQLLGLTDVLRIILIVWKSSGAGPPFWIHRSRLEEVIALEFAGDLDGAQEPLAGRRCEPSEA